MASESFMFDLTPDQQALVDDFMTNTYPKWKGVMDQTASTLGAINTGAATDWGKQKDMIGKAQVPINFTLGGGNLMTMVPYKTSMGNAIDKETAYKSAAAQAPLAAEQAKVKFYSDTVAPMQQARMTSLGQLGYVDIYNPATKNSAKVPISMFPELQEKGWQLGAPDEVTMKRNMIDQQLNAAKPGLGDAWMGALDALYATSKTWTELVDSGLVDKVMKALGMSMKGLIDTFDLGDYVSPGDYVNSGQEGWML
jgi:hypothetical protein